MIERRPLKMRQLRNYEKKIQNVLQLHTNQKKKKKKKKKKKNVRNNVGPLIDNDNDKLISED